MTGLWAWLKSLMNPGKMAVTDEDFFNIHLTFLQFRKKKKFHCVHKCVAQTLIPHSRLERRAALDL